MGLDVFKIFIVVFILAGVFGGNLTYDGYYTKQLNYVGADGHTITLYNNPNATNPTYQQVLDFMDDDYTDDTYYSDGVFTCGDYAEAVHNNAERAGYVCGWVSVDFVDGGIGHACNVFNTTDRGFVFIDCTRSDKTIDLQVGKPYIPVSIYQTDYTYDSMGIVSDYNIYW